MSAEAAKAPAPGHSVQSVERAFSILEAMAEDTAGIGISSLAETLDLPLPTIHRLTRTLVGLGYIHQDANRRYVLGPRLIHLGEQAKGTLTVFARPHLLDLVNELGETSNLARLDGTHMVYLAQVPSRHSMRMFTEVGRRVPLHCTAVGKAVLADLPERQARALLPADRLEAVTDRTITDADEFMAHLAIVRQRGYAVDDEEQERGVRCVAVAVPGAPAPVAMSVSGPVGRIAMKDVSTISRRLKEVAALIGADLA